MQLQWCLTGETISNITHNGQTLKNDHAEIFQYHINEKSNVVAAHRDSASSLKGDEHGDTFQR